MATPPVLEISEVTVTRDGRRLLDRLSLVIPRGRHTAVLGPNGAGKTSLVRVIAKDLYPSCCPPEAALPGSARDASPEGDPGERRGRGGSVRILGREDWEVARLRRRLGIVSPAVDADFSHGRPGRSTAREVVAGGFTATMLAEFGPPSTPELRASVDRALARCDATALAERRLATLSTGERRRVLIARALVHDPALLMLDEPTTGLDPRARDGFLRTLRRLCHTPALTVLLVTHHLEEVVPEFGHVVLLDCGQVVFDGPAREALAATQIGRLFAERSPGPCELAGSVDPAGAIVAADGPTAGDPGGGRAEPASDISRRLLDTLSRLETLVAQDPLTGLDGRRRLDASVVDQVEAAARTGRPCTAAVLDIDRFREINSRHGHRAGDQCLRQVAALLRGFVPGGAAAFRSGGDEFVLLLPDRGPAEAIAILERLRRAVGSCLIHHDGEPLPHVTVSIGAASVEAAPTGSPADPPGLTAAWLLSAADAAMYAAKRAGGDAVEFWGGPPARPGRSAATPEAGDGAAG